MTRSAPSFAGRAALSVALLAGFYLLALAVAGTLLYLPYAEWEFTDRVNGRVLLFCLLGAIAILRGIMPRVDRFDPPFPRLEPDAQPRFFGVVRGVADACAQEMPAEVYLLPEMNAWVAQRGGVMGFGSRRVMGVGLPLMQALGVDQLRAVLAHEFGHFHGGDTRLGPWVYKTRGAIERTLAHLGRHSSVLQKPFLWYGKLFLRITHAVSRQQEFTADALAARTVGAVPMVEGLKTVHAADSAFDTYWRQEVSPALGNGFLPPLAEGFGRFMAVPHVATHMTAVVDREMSEGRSTPYDTHPSLRERIDALRELPPGPQEDRTPSISLLDGVPALEAALVRSALARPPAEGLRPMGWDEVTEKVWMPAWVHTVTMNLGRLAGVTPPKVAVCAGDPAGLASRLGYTPKQQGDAFATMGAALMLALGDAGWEPHAPPGHEVWAERGGVRLEPFTVLRGLLNGEVTAEEWVQTWTDAGVADADLGAVGAVGAVSA